MSNTGTNEQPDPAANAYVVDPNYRPNLSAQVGSQRTDAQGSFNIRNISPIFDHADRRSALLAKHALDPRDPTPASHVNFPEGAVQSHETITQRLRDIAERVEKRFTPAPQDYLAASADRSAGAMTRSIAEAEAAKAPAEAPEATVEAPVAAVAPEPSSSTPSAPPAASAETAPEGVSGSPTV